MDAEVHNCKSAPCPVCGSLDGSGNPIQADTKTIYLSIPLDEFKRLHAEIDRLQAQIETARAAIVGSEKEIARLRTELRGYEWGLSNAAAEEHDIRES